jgi:hypothetical protein
MVNTCGLSFTTDVVQQFVSSTFVLNASGNVIVWSASAHEPVGCGPC